MLRVEQHKGFGNDFQPSSSFQVSGRQQSNDYDKVNSNLEEFVKYFVKEFEAKLHAYHMILEGEVKKAGEFSDTFSKKVGKGTGGVIGGGFGLLLVPFMGSAALRAGVTGGAALGEGVGGALGGKLGEEHHRKKVISLSELVYSSKKNKANVRRMLVEAGFDIFQSFEMQFMRVTTDQGHEGAMRKLAKDATNRAISYYMQKEDALITEGVVLGKSKIEPVLGVPIATSKIKTPGFKVNYKYKSIEKEWVTASLYKKVGLVLEKKNPSYYEKKDGKSKAGKYGYRRLFTSEDWNKLKNECKFSDVVKNGQFTDYQYILNLENLKSKVTNILEKINSDDKDLTEERVRKVLEEVKDDIIKEINTLKKQSHEYTEDHKILKDIKANLKDLKVDEYLKKFKQYFEEAKQERQKIAKSIEASREESRENFNQLSQKQDIHHGDNKREHKKTQAGVENANQGINNLQKVLVEHGRKLDYLLMNYNDLMKSKLEHINLPTDGKDKISQEVTKLHDAVSAGEKKDVETLLKGKVEVNAKTVDSLITPLHIAAQNGNRKIVDDLLNVKNIDVNAKTQQGATPLHYAAKNGHKEIVKALLSKDARVDVKTSNDYFTPLHHAAENGYKEIVELLLNRGAKINRTNNQGATALHLAAESSHKEVVEYLLARKDIAIDVKTAGDECTPLYYAAQNGFNEVVKTLLNKDDKVINTKNFEGNTPLHVAVYHNHVDVVKTLLDKGASVNEINDLGATPLHYAAQNNFIDVVEALLKVDNINVNVKMEGEGATPLHYAAENGYKKVVEVLLDKDADFSIQTTDQHLTPLHIAARANHRKVIEVLLDKGANIDVQTADQKFTPLHIAARLNNIEVVKVLLDREAKVDLESARGNTPLCLAVQSGHVDVVKALLDKGADIDAQNGGQGATSLHAAAEGGHKKIVEVLLNKGANVNVQTIDQQCLTPLHMAARSGHNEIVKILLDKGADINVQTADQGLTPLHLAAALGEKEVVNVLLDKGANANVGAIEDFTPLHLAAQNGHKDIVNVLLENDAKIDVKTTQGATPLHYASEKSNWEMAVILLKYGADVNDLDADQKEKLLNFALNKNYQDVIRLFPESPPPETYLSDVTARNQQRLPHL